jgi:hypothetical protein
MTLSITNKDNFLNNFLSPLSKITDSAVISVNKGKITSLISTSDNTIIVDANYSDDKIDVKKTLNIPDLKKLFRVISCIDEDNFDLDISSNFIGYSSKNVRFKYHLYDDGIISSPKLNVEKLKTFSFDGSFTLPYAAVVNLVKGSSISTETNKIYISVKDKIVFGELTDKTRANIDSYGIQVADNYDGTQFALAIPLNFEIFRIISSMRFKELQTQLITKMGVLTFDLNLDNAQFKFVVSALAN